MKIIAKNELKAEEVHRMVLETLQSHLSLKTEGYRCSTEQVLNVVLKAAAEGSSLEAVCSDHPGGVDGNTVPCFPPIHIWRSTVPRTAAKVP
jgi:hypothetical protein